MRLTPRPQVPEEPGQFWKEFFRDTAPVFRKPTIEQLPEIIAPTFKALIDGAKHVNGRLHEIIDEVKPDLIVEDNVIAFPALPACERSWARIASCNPTEIKDHEVPPGPSLGSQSTPIAPEWDKYWVAYRKAHREIHDGFDDFCQDNGAPPRPTDDFIHESPWLNLYLSGRGRLRSYSAARLALAQPAGERARHRPDLGPARATGRSARPTPLPKPWLAGVSRLGADARPDRLPGRGPLPGDAAMRTLQAASRRSRHGCEPCAGLSSPPT
jgi:UDP:flavonoid glycosyltransferase YjiC (YdhE family)